MIEGHYELDMAPFRLTPDPNFFYAGQTHTKALAYLRYGLQQGEGVIVLTGDAGTGKSTLISYLLSQLDPSKHVTAHLATSNLEPSDVLQMAATALNVVATGTSKADILGDIARFVEEQREQGRKVLLIVDEVQNMPRASLEELRMLTNLNRSDGSGVQCFLIGQTQFRDLLDHPEMEQLRQRVIGSCHLEPFSIEETQNYIAHRLEVANWQGKPSFDESIPAMIHKVTGGIPRRINVLFARLLVHGAIEKRDHLDKGDCQSAIEDLEAEMGKVAITPRLAGQKSGRQHALSGGLTASNTAQSSDLGRLERRIDELETIVIELIHTMTDLMERHEAGNPKSDNSPTATNGR